MVAAHLAHEMRRAGAPNVVVIDLDPQNALRLHYGVPMSLRFGIVNCIEAGLPWDDAAIPSTSDVVVYPFGALSLPLQAEFDQAVRVQPGLIANEVLARANEPETIVIVDTPPGYSAAFSSLLPVADIIVTVMTPEASCISLIPDIKNGACYGASQHEPASFVHRVIVNRFDPMNRISAMAMPQISRHFGNMILGTICRDEHVGEAFASQKLVQSYAPYCRATADLELVGSRLVQIIENLIERRGRL